MCILFIFHIFMNLKQDEYEIYMINNNGDLFGGSCEFLQVYELLHYLELFSNF